MTIDLTPEGIARLFHDTYERLAPEFGYSTRPETRQFDADSINGRLMIRVAEEVLLALADAMEERDRLRDLLHRVDPERVDLAGSEQSWERQSEELSQTVLRVAEQRDKALADLEAAREVVDFVIREFTEKGWAFPAQVHNVVTKLIAVRAAREGR